MFQRYLNRSDQILDIGCGAGRVTIGLYRLGFSHVGGIDFSKGMIDAARNLAQENGYPISFRIGEATSLDYDDESFDSAIFAFNGLMQIPLKENRTRAILEAKRVLKPGGIFIFTTHDRDMGLSEERKRVWKEERDQWINGSHDPRKAEYGDVFFVLKGVEGFIHVPDREEVTSAIDQAALELVETSMRTEICEESEAVEEFSNNCRFWVVRK